MAKKTSTNRARQALKEREEAPAVVKVAKKKALKDVPRKWAKLYQDALNAPTGGKYWSPENDGDAIAGKVLGKRKQKGQFGTQPVLTIKDELTGKTMEVSCPTVLANLVEEHEITEGSEVLIVFRGFSKTGRKGRPARLYTLQTL